MSGWLNSVATVWVCKLIEYTAINLVRHSFPFFCEQLTQKCISCVHITMARYTLLQLLLRYKMQILTFYSTEKKEEDENEECAFSWLKGAYYSQPFERLIFASFSGRFVLFSSSLCVSAFLLRIVSTVCRKGIGCAK